MQIFASIYFLENSLKIIA